MATSKVDLFNLALANISARAFVESLTEDSNERKYCSANYDAAVRAVLEDHDWNFASAHATLALDSDDPISPWLYRYTYPSKCIAAREIVKESDDAPEIPFKVDLDTAFTGKVIHTDQEQAVLRYTREVLTPGLFSPHAVIAAGWKLGSMIAIPLTHKLQIKQICDQEYQRTISEARAMNSNEAVKRDDPTPDTIQARS